MKKYTESELYERKIIAQYEKYIPFMSEKLDIPINYLKIHEENGFVYINGQYRYNIFKKDIDEMMEYLNNPNWSITHGKYKMTLTIHLKLEEFERIKEEFELWNNMNKYNL